MRQLRRLNLKRKELPTITLTPLIDTVLVLLIIFMVTSPTKTPTHQSVKNELKADTSCTALVVAIDAQGALSLDGVDIKDTELLAAVKARLLKLPFKVIRLYAQPGASLPLVHKVIDTLRGIEGVKLAFW